MVTLAIYTYEKAVILKNILENEGIGVVVENVNRQQPLISSGVRVCVNVADLPKALSVIDNCVSFKKVANRSGSGKSKIVLVPVDFSEYSIKACEVGFLYAYKKNYQVVILHSYIGRDYSGSLPLGNLIKDKKISEYFRKKEERAKKLMFDFEQQIHSHIESGELPDVICKFEIMEGIPESAILEYSKNSNPALIVMGTRGTHKKEQDLIGSVTAEVLDSSKYPMYVIPEDIAVANLGHIKHVVFYCNLEQQDLLSLDVFVREFENSDAEISLVHVPEKKEKMVSERMDEMLKYCTNQYNGTAFKSKIFDENTFLTDFDNFLRDNSVEIVVIPNKRRNIFARLFSPSLAHRILFHTDIPMLVVPIK